MEQELERQIIKEARERMKSRAAEEEETDYQSDQDKKLPQPPLVKAPMRSEQIDLPRDFKPLGLEQDLLSVIVRRCSSRVYTQQPVSLLQLSFLLWATQGIKEIRGKSYATLRTVPCGGARHPFETYLMVRNVEGLEPGAYHYLPMSHQLEFLHPVEELDETVNTSLCGQRWAAKAGVVFYWSFVPYRSEWRYGIYAHRMVMADVGHVGENLYLACSALGLGTCGIGAYDQKLCDRLFELDGDEEFTLYTQSVGAIRAEDAQEEKDFYKFVEEQGL